MQKRVYPGDRNFGTSNIYFGESDTFLQKKKHVCYRKKRQWPDELEDRRWAVHKITGGNSDIPPD